MAIKVLNNKLLYCCLTAILIISIILISSTASAGSGQSALSVKTYGYVTNHYSNSISVIDTATNNVVDSIDLGSSPYGVAVNPDGKKVYVTNPYDNAVSVIDTATSTVAAKVSVGHGPLGIAASPDGKKVYVTNYNSSSISVIDTADNKVTATLTVGEKPVGVAVNPKGTKVYVTNWGSGQVSVIDAATNNVTATVPVGNKPYGVAVTPDGAKIYVANQGSNTVSVIGTNSNDVVVIYSKGKTAFDTDLNKVIATVDVGTEPYGVTVSPDGKKVYVTNSGEHSVSVIDTVKNEYLNTVNVDNYPLGVSVNPDGTKVYVANEFSNTISVIDTGTDKVTATVNVESNPIALGQFVGSVTVATPLPMVVSMSSEPGSVDIDKPSIIAVAVTGSDGKGISGANVSLSTDVGEVTPASGRTDSLGKFTSTFTTSDEGMATINASVEKKGFVRASGETNVKGTKTFSMIPLIILFALFIGILIIDRKRLLLQVEPGSIPADGNSTATVIIKIKDIKGSFVTSKKEKTVELTTTRGTITSPMKIPAGAQEGTAIITSGLEPGVAEVKASSSSLGKATAKVDFLPNEFGLDIQIDPGSVFANGQSKAKVIVKLKDDKGKFVPSPNGRTVKLSTTRGIIDNQVVIPPGAQEGIAYITAGSEIGTAVVTASSGTIKEAAARVDFVPNEVSLDIRIEPGSICADGHSKAKAIIRIKNGNGKFIPSRNERTVKLLITSGTIDSQVLIPPGEMEGIACITSGSKVGSAEVKASSSPLKEATARVDFVPNEVSLNIQIEPGSVCADGQSKAKVIIKIKDDKGNFVTSHKGRVVNLTISRGRGTIDSQMLIPPGTQEGIAYITSGLEIGIAEVTASSILEGDTKSLNGTGKVTFTLPSEDPACSVMTK